MANSAINSAKILLNLCKGIARSKVFLIILLAYAHEIFMISTEEKE